LKSSKNVLKSLILPEVIFKKLLKRLLYDRKKNKLRCRSILRLLLKKINHLTSKFWS
jgi:hypothetical protein